MTTKEAGEYLKLKDFKGGPQNIKVGDMLDGGEIVAIKGMVNGKPTYASTFIVKRDMPGNSDSNVNPFFKSVSPVNLPEIGF